MTRPKEGKVFTPQKSYKGILSALRRLNRAWDAHDMTLLLSCVSEFARERDMTRPRSVSTVLGHRLLADNLCFRYGLQFQYPNTVVGDRGRKVVLPTYQVVHAHNSVVRNRSTFGLIDKEDSHE